MTSEEVQRHMMAQHLYQQQYMHPPSQQAQQIAQSNGQFRAGTTNAGIGSMHPLAIMQHGPDSSGSPSTESGLSVKRPAEVSPIDGSSKKPRLAGKRPSKRQRTKKDLTDIVKAPEEHQRQAMEMAQRAAQQMPAPPGVPQMPGQMHQLVRAPSQVSMANQHNIASHLHDQTVPRSVSDAERQYALGQAAYARQQVINSPANQVAMSPAHVVEPSLIGIGQSPSVMQSGFDVSLTATPTSAKSKKAKQTPSLVLNIDNTADRPEITPPSGGSTKRKQPRKASKAGTGATRGRGGKGSKGSRASIGEVAGETPPAATPSYSVNGTPTVPPSAMFGEPGLAPNSGQSMTFQLPQSGMEHNLPERYAAENQHRQQQDHQAQTRQYPHDQQGQSQHGQHPGSATRGGIHQSLQQEQPPDGQQSQPPTASQNNFADDFLKALNSYGNEGGSAPQQPAAAFQANFDESAFDFDVSARDLTRISS